MPGNRFQFSVLIALVAMVLRGVLPAGWMPQAPADNGAFLTICSPNGVIHLAGDLASKPTAPAKSSQHSDVCPFAAGLHTFDIAATATPTPQLHAFLVASIFPSRETARLSLRRKAFFARGPPLSA